MSRYFLHKMEPIFLLFFPDLKEILHYCRKYLHGADLRYFLNSAVTFFLSDSLGKVTVCGGLRQLGMPRACPLQSLNCVNCDAHNFLCWGVQ